MMHPLDRLLRYSVVALCSLAFAASARSGDTIRLTARDTLAAVEMEHGDRLEFTLRCGRTVTLVLDNTRAAIVERVEPGGIVYQFSCDVRIDGQPVTLRRFVCSQECFYEPYVISGLRIWPDTVKAVFDLVPVRYPRPGHLQCVPRKAARFAVQDAALRICPEETHPWLDEPQNFLDVGRCYNGDDCYLGPYLGQACHVGMDINHRKGSPLLAPIAFDTQAYFNSLAAGDNNNRWRGIRRWENGDVWALQTHHLIDLLIPQNTPLPIGTKYATTAGTAVGSHEHTHFEFKIGRKHADAPLSGSDDPASIACPIDFEDQSSAAQDNPEILHLDPWIVFWQIFEDRKARQSDLRATIAPLAPVRTGESVRFAAELAEREETASGLRGVWTFGDGGTAEGLTPQHVYARPGIYPVTLVVQVGDRRATSTHHLVVNGEAKEEPAPGIHVSELATSQRGGLVLEAPDESSFRLRPAAAVDVYGWTVKQLPHTLHFVARASRPVPNPRTLTVRNSAGRGVSPLTVSIQGAADRHAWLRVAADEEAGQLRVAVDATGLAVGTYTAAVQVASDGAVNSPQSFRVVLEVRDGLPGDAITIDDSDAGFYATPYFWVGHRFSRVPIARRGFKGFYLTNGGVAAAGEFVRWTPDLRRGAYAVSLHEATPFGKDVEFDVRVRHRGGDEVVRVAPSRSREIGVFEFDEGADGYVEILAEGSTGLVVADAIVFRMSGDAR